MRDLRTKAEKESQTVKKNDLEDAGQKKKEKKSSSEPNHNHDYEIFFLEEPAKLHTNVFFLGNKCRERKYLQNMLGFTVPRSEK